MCLSALLPALPSSFPPACSPGCAEGTFFGFWPKSKTGRIPTHRYPRWSTLCEQQHPIPIPGRKAIKLSCTCESTESLSLQCCLAYVTMLGSPLTHKTLHKPQQLVHLTFQQGRFFSLEKCKHFPLESCFQLTFFCLFFFFYLKAPFGFSVLIHKVLLYNFWIKKL